MDFLLKQVKLILLNLFLSCFSLHKWVVSLMFYAERDGLKDKERLIPRYLDESLFGGISDVEVVMTDDITKERRAQILDAATNIIEDLKVRRTAKSLQINLYDYIVNLLYEKKLISEEEIEFITEFKVIKDLRLNSLVQPNIKVSSTNPTSSVPETEKTISLSRKTDQIIKIF